MSIAIRWHLIEDFTWHRLIMIKTETLASCILMTDVISACRYKETIYI